MYLTDLVIVLDRDFDFEDVIQHNLQNAGKRFRLLIFNNGCVDPEASLLENASIYLKNNSPIEMSWAECVNQLIPHLSGEFVAFIHEYAYYSENWLDKLVDAHCKNFKSGAVSINNGSSLDFTFILSEEELSGVYENTGFQGGMFITSRDIFRSVGLFDEKLKDHTTIWHYIARISLLGYSSYSLPETYCIPCGTYSGTFVTKIEWYKRYLAKTRNDNSIFIPIVTEDQTHLEIKEALKNVISFPIQFSERLGCIVLFAKELDQETILIVSDICKNFKKSFSIIPSSYFEDFLLKTSILILIK